MSALQSDRRVTWVTAISLMLVVGVALVYVFSAQVGEEAMAYIIDIADAIAVIACVVLCLALRRASVEGEPLRRVWSLLGAGLTMWGLAEAIYAVYELVLLQETPVLSLADILWVLGYIPILSALWLRYRLLRVPLTRNQWIGLLTGFAVLAVLSVVYVIIPSLPSAEEMPSATGDLAGLASLALSVLYLVGDLLMALGAGLMILSLMGGLFSRAWAFIAVGCLAIALADSLYYGGLAGGMYSPEIPVNLFTAVSDISYLAGYVTIALGLFAQARLQRAV